MSGGFRAILQASVYFTIGMVRAMLFLYFIMGWEMIDVFMLGSIISKTGAVVIVPLAKRIGVQAEMAAILSIEATVTSIFNIVFFSAFLEARLSGVLNLAEAITLIVAKFSVGIVVGVILPTNPIPSSERRVHVYGHAGDTAVWLYHFRNAEGKQRSHSPHHRHHFRKRQRSLECLGKVLRLRASFLN
ncbi:MAG: hypothetical protein QW612_06220 [Candidatus Bathyarchaeia archaeon]